MNIDDRIYLRRVPLMVIGVFALGLAACDPKSPTEQASKDPGRIVEQSSSPAAGKEVDPAKSAMDKDNTAKSGTTVDDLALSIKVEDALKSNPTLKSLPITVRTADGVVTLSGTADTTANRDQAEQLVMTVAGVKSVDNKLAVGGA